MTVRYDKGGITVHHSDALDVLRGMADASVDSVCTDPPYDLTANKKGGSGVASLNVDSPAGRARISTGFMGKAWDGTGIAFRPAVWVECLRVLKPGGHLLAFGGSRTSHRLACAIEDAGFEIRDSIVWLYGQGFAKSLNLDNLKNSPFCQCDKGEWNYDRDVQRVWSGVPAAMVTRSTGHKPNVLTSMQREDARPRVGDVRSTSAEDAGTVRSEVRSGQPGLEGWRDPQAAEGQLHGGPLRSLPARVRGDGTDGRLHHGAPSSDGDVGRSSVDADGSGESQGPESSEQPAVELGTVPDQRGPQARGSWPLCTRCSQPVVPAGLGTALKPAHEPIVCARKPLAGTVAQTVLAYGTGALNVDGCRVGTTPTVTQSNGVVVSENSSMGGPNTGRDVVGTAVGRWPANVVLSHTPDCDGVCAPGGCPVAALDAQSGETSFNPAGTFGTHREDGPENTIYGKLTQPGTEVFGYGDTGGASRFFPTFDADPPWFYTAKAGTAERVRDDRGGEGEGRVTGLGGKVRECNTCGSRAINSGAVDLTCGHLDHRWVDNPRPKQVAHPTVKPLALMRWLVRLVTPPLTPDGLPGLVLDPFAGSGTTAEAALLEGFRCVTVEREAEYLPLILQRLNRRRDPVAYVRDKGGDGGLFDLLDAGPVASPPADTRAGEASAERRYDDRGGTNFAAKPGRRRP